MKYETATALVAIFGLSLAAPAPKPFPARMLRGREVPQEHSHEKFLTSVRKSLNIDNPEGISDVVFGLLGDAAAKGNCGTVTNLACCHQATADRAYTNAKAAGDVQAQADALIFATLERNTIGIGTKSALCTDQAANPEIAALTQHQDPASDGAAAGNKAVALELAKQLASIGADPQLALESGTFAPGDKSDGSGKGNTCDNQDDPIGCIFTQNLLVEDATAAEIDAAVAGVAAGGNAAGGKAAGGKATGGNAAGGKAAGKAAGGKAAGKAAGGKAAGKANGGKANGAKAAGGKAAGGKAAGGAAGGAAVAECPAAAIETVTVDAPAATQTKAADTAAGGATAGGATAGGAAAGGATATNVQTFTGTLGGAAPAVESSAGNRPFSVNGNTFVNIGAALQRSCAIQNNACANAINSKAVAGSVSDCNTQEKACNAAASAKAKRQALDLGSCPDPSIVFEEGLDGRDQAAFIANDDSKFNHGSALNIGVIASFVCGQLQSACKAGASAVAACKEGQAAAAKATGQASADAFNAALGF